MGMIQRADGSTLTERIEEPCLAPEIFRDAYGFSKESREQTENFIKFINLGVDEVY